MKITKTKQTPGILALLVFIAFGMSSPAQTIITNITFDTPVTTSNWGNWFGAQYVTNIWSTNDAATNPASGSLEIVGAFTGGSQQLLVWKGANGFNPPLNGNAITNLEFDIRFDPTSAVAGNGTFGGMAFWTRDGSFTPVQLGNYTSISSGNLNWVHFQIPINAVAQPALVSIPTIGFQIHTFGTTMTGTSIMYVDNIKFSGPAVVPTNPPPIMSIAPAQPALRIFAGDTGNQFSREELATVDQNQSWIGGTFPVSYSFTLLSYPNNINQTHIFLVPVNSTPGASPYGYNGVDYTATNGLWLTLNPGPNAGSVVASIYWKTNLPGANAFDTGGNTALKITNATAIGTWKLSFTSPSAGTLTAPGASPVSFTIADGTVATDFANPLVAYFGLQPNSTAGEGQFEDWASISITNVTGANVTEDFTKEASISGNWNNMSQQPASIALVTTNNPYWVNWTLPDTGFGLAISPGLRTPADWHLPGYYNGFFGNDGTPTQYGLKHWLLVTPDILPSNLGITNGTTFFRLSNPPPNN
jgi:hypothetical protein